MRDHRHGENWDHRTLDDLTWHRIRVVSIVCRHYSYLRPVDLAKRYPDRQRWGWRQFIPKLRCTHCGKKKVSTTAERLPRN